MRLALYLYQEAHSFYKAPISDSLLMIIDSLERCRVETLTPHQLIYALPIQKNEALLFDLIRFEVEAVNLQVTSLKQPIDQ